MRPLPNYNSYLRDYLITNVFQTADGVLKPSGDHGDRMAGVREWDRDKGKVEERDRDREDRRQDRDRREVGSDAKLNISFRW